MSHEPTDLEEGMDYALYVKELTWNIKKVEKIFSQYDYSKVEYINNKTKVCIICPEHGEFWSRPNDLLSGYGCKKCADNTLKTNEEFIEQCIKEGKQVDYFLYPTHEHNVSGKDRVHLNAKIVDYFITHLKK